MSYSKTSSNADAGFTYLEVLVGGTLLLIGLLAVAGMFVTGYANVNGAGNTTMGLSAARQVLEDVRRLPYDNLVNLDGFDTEDPGTLPASDPEREVARRWRYAVAGEGVGWSFTDEEKARWPDLALQGDELGGVGTIDVTQQTASLTAIDIEVSVPGHWRTIQLSTLISRN